MLHIGTCKNYLFTYLLNVFLRYLTALIYTASNLTRIVVQITPEEVAADWISIINSRML